MTRAGLWAFLVIITAVATSFVNEVLPQGSFSRPFRAEVYLGISAVPPSNLESEMDTTQEERSFQIPVDESWRAVSPELYDALIEQNQLIAVYEEYFNRSMGISQENQIFNRGLFNVQQSLSNKNFDPGVYDFAAIRLSNDGRDLIENVSIRFNGEVFGYVIGSSGTARFESGSLLELDDINPNESRVILVWNQSMFGSFAFLQNPNFRIASSFGEPASIMVGGPTGNNFPIFAGYETIKEILIWALIVIGTVIVAFSPIFIDFYIEKHREALLLDLEYYKLERSELLSKKNREIIKKRAIELANNGSSKTESKNDAPDREFPEVEPQL